MSEFSGHYIDLGDRGEPLSDEQFKQVIQENLSRLQLVAQLGDTAGSMELAMPPDAYDASMVWGAVADRISPKYPQFRFQGMNYERWQRQPGDDPSLPAEIVTGGYRAPDSEQPAQLTLVLNDKQTQRGLEPARATIYPGIPEAAQALLTAKG